MNNSPRDSVKSHDSEEEKFDKDGKNEEIKYENVQDEEIKNDQTAMTKNQRKKLRKKNNKDKKPVELK